MAHEEARPAESLWTSRDVAAFLRIGRDAVHEMANNRDLPSLRVGSRIRFVPEEIRAWLERQRAPDATVRHIGADRPLAKSASMREGEAE